MAVPRGTTPTFTLILLEENLDLTVANNVYVTFTSGSQNITKSGSNLTIRPKEIDVYFSQEETLGFGTGPVEIQANWTYQNGRRAASDVASYRFSKQLLNRVVT